MVKPYLNSTFKPPIVLLKINSKLEAFYGLKDGRRDKCRVMVLFGDLKLRNCWRKSEPRDLRSLMQEQLQAPSIFPRLFSLLASSVLSCEAEAHFLWRYFNSFLPSPAYIPCKPPSTYRKRENNPRRTDVTTTVLPT